MKRRRAASPRGRFAVVASRWHAAIADRLVAGAVRRLRAAGVEAEVWRVPGVFEVPLAAASLAATGRYAGIVATGVVLKGETPHFDLIVAEATRGIAAVALSTGVPVAHGIVATATAAQARARAGGGVGHRGAEAAAAALEMAEVVRRIGGRS